MLKYRFEDIAYNITAKRLPTADDMATYIGLEHLDSGSLRVSRWGSAVPIKGEKLIMSKGDVLFGKRNAYLRRAAIAPHDGLFSAHGMILRPKEEVIDKDFFPLFIASDYFIDMAIRISVGSISPTINWKDLKNVEFLIPELSVQRELAGVLWALNRTKEAYKRVIEKTDQLVQSQFIEMFGKSKRVRLGDYIQQIRGVSYKPADLSSELDSEHITLLRANNVGGGEVNFDEVQYVDRNKVSEKQVICKNDILMCASSGSLEHVGKTALCIFDGEYTFGAFCKLIRVTKEIAAEYVAAYFQGDEYRRIISDLAQGANINNLRNEHVDDLQIPYPDSDVQEKFIDFLKQLDKSKFIAFQAIAMIQKKKYNTINAQERRRNEYVL